MFALTILLILGILLVLLVGGLAIPLLLVIVASITGLWQ